MKAVATHPYIEALARGSHDLPGSPAGWLNARRSQALERANALTVPTTRDEEWRFTDITPLTKINFKPATGAAPLTLQDIAGFAVPEAQCRLVFVDGIYAPELSVAGKLPAGVRIATLSAAIREQGAVLEQHLARHAASERNVFVALNTAYLRDGVVVHVAKNQVCATPLHVLYVATQNEVAAYPRCLVVAESGSECTVIEDYVSLTDGAYFTNAVTEIVVADAARVRHIKLQRESKAAFHIAHSTVKLDKDATYTGNAVTLGARISRYSLDVLQNGEGAAMNIDGLALIAGRQLADTHTLMAHHQPNGRSNQLHKTIVGGAAHAVFNGKVYVHEGAQLTDSAQQSRNLLLSGKAHVDTKPQLEIFADDVKCAHGATVGQIDAEQLFYLKSRGLTDQKARNLLTYAFGAELIERIPVPSLVAQLENIVLEQTQTLDSAAKGAA